jgi:predicted dienelactone hydrolase
MNWNCGTNRRSPFRGLMASLSCVGALSVTAMPLPARAIEVVQVKFPFDLGTYTVKVSELVNSKALLNGTSDLAELDRATDGKIGQLLAKGFLTPLPLSKATFQGGGGTAIVDQVIAGLAALGQLQGLTSQQQSQQEFKAAIKRATEVGGPVTLLSILQQLPGQSASFDLGKMLANMQRNAGLMRAANQLVASLPPATTDPQFLKPGTLPIASRRLQLVVAHRQAPVEMEVIAPTRNPNGKLVVISHGLWDSPNSFWGWAEHLASYGYTVILPVHQGSDKGQQTAMLDGSAPPPSPAELRLRPQDVKAILDAVADGRLAGFQGIDTKNVVAIGHSWGGVTAGQLAGMRANGDLLRLRCPNRNDPDESISWVLQCSFVNAIADFNISDSRVKAIVVVSPPIGLIADPRIGQDGLHARILLISGSRDFVVPPDPEAIGPFGMAPADGHHLVLAKGGDHFNLRAPKGEKTVAVLSPVILAWVNGAFAAGPSVAPGPNAPDLLPAKGWGSPTMVLVDVPREKARR